jgi:hypothetical protein
MARFACARGASAAKSNTLLKSYVGRLYVRDESLSACSRVYAPPVFMLCAPRVQVTTSRHSKLFCTNSLGPKPC